MLVSLRQGSVDFGVSVDFPMGNMYLRLIEWKFTSQSKLLHLYQDAPLLKLQKFTSILCLSMALP